MKKLDSKTLSCYFISYPERSKGFKFYCHSQGPKIVGIRYMFLENEDCSRTIKLKKFTSNGNWFIQENEVSTLVMKYGVIQEDSHNESENSRGFP